MQIVVWKEKTHVFSHRQQVVLNALETFAITSSVRSCKEEVEEEVASKEEAVLKEEAASRVNQ